MFQESAPSMADMPEQWIARPEVAAPALGDPHQHRVSQQQLINDILLWDSWNGTHLDRI